MSHRELEKIMNVDLPALVGRIAVLTGVLFTGMEYGPADAFRSDVVGAEWSAPANAGHGRPVIATEGESWGAFVNVRDFGATGNGNTPEDDAIRAALAALDPDPEDNLGAVGTIYFPAGLYKLKEPIRILTAQATAIRLVGDGLDTVIRYFGEGLNRPTIWVGADPEAEHPPEGAASTNWCGLADQFTPHPASNVEIANVTLVGDVANAPGIGIQGAGEVFVHDTRVWAGKGIQGCGYAAHSINVRRVDYLHGTAPVVFRGFVPGKPSGIGGAGLELEPAAGLPGEPFDEITLQVRDFVQGAGSHEALVLRRSEGTPPLNVLVDGAHSDGRQVELAVEVDVPPDSPDDRVRLSNVRIETLDPILRIRGLASLTLENVSKVVAVELQECERVSLQNVQGSELIVKGAGDFPVESLTALSSLFKKGQESKAAFDRVRNWLIAGMPIDGLTGIHFAEE